MDRRGIYEAFGYAYKIVLVAKKGIIMHLIFDHIALRAKEPERIKSFLIALGFEEGERPNFPFDGYWLYSEGKPVIHIFGGGARFRDEENMGRSRHPKHIVDHICFASDDYAAVMQTIKRHGFEYSSNVVPQSNIAQIFLRGPENLIIEIQAKIN